MDQRTPNLSPVIQEIVGRPGWAPGNALVLIITGTGKRVAESYEGDPGGAALLHVEYSLGAPVNRAPIVDAGLDQTLILPTNSVLLNGTVTDDGLTGVLATTWSQVSGPGLVTFADAAAVDTTATFSLAGTYVLQLTADDSEFISSDQTTVVVNEPGTSQILEVRVASGSDDAEETSSGGMELTSSDLDMGDRTVGLRFTGISVPPAATILNAYVQFQADGSPSEVTSLRIEGQAIDNAPTFTSSARNISSRIRTAAFVAWSPPPWIVGEAGANEQTPDLASLIQEIVDRPGWLIGNSLAIIITGPGLRDAECFESLPAGAPLLHIEYTAN
jgi:hypothetical protein